MFLVPNTSDKEVALNVFWTMDVSCGKNFQQTGRGCELCLWCPERYVLCLAGNVVHCPLAEELSLRSCKKGTLCNALSACRKGTSGCLSLVPTRCWSQGAPTPTVAPKRSSQAPAVCLQSEVLIFPGWPQGASARESPLQGARGTALRPLHSASSWERHATLWLKVEASTRRGGWNALKGELLKPKNRCLQARRGMDFAWLEAAMFQHCSPASKLLRPRNWG